MLFSEVSCFNFVETFRQLFLDSVHLGIYIFTTLALEVGMVSETIFFKEIDTTVNAIDCSKLKAKGRPNLRLQCPQQHEAESGNCHW